MASATGSTVVPLVSSSTAGPLGAIHLPRLWAKLTLHNSGKLAEGYDSCGQGFDQMTLNGLGLDRQRVIDYIAQARSRPTCSSSNGWSRRTAATIPKEKIDAHNAAIRGYNHGDDLAKSMRTASGVPHDTSATPSRSTRSKTSTSCTLKRRRDERSGSGRARRAGDRRADPARRQRRRRERAGALLQSASRRRREDLRVQVRAVPRREPGGRRGAAAERPQHDHAGTKTHLTVGDMFGYIVSNMPMNAPASLSHDQYVAVLSYILNKNGYPAGSKPLTYASANASKVLVRSYK